MQDTIRPGLRGFPNTPFAYRAVACVMDGDGAVNRQKIDMWRRSALHARLKAACAHDATTEKLLLDVAAQYDDLIDQETGALRRAKTSIG